MTKKTNGWKRAGLIAGTIIALAGATAVVMPYTYLIWAPAVSFVWAAESRLSQYQTQLTNLRIMESKALDANPVDYVALKVVRPMIADVESKIDEVKEEQAKRKK